MYEDLKRIDPTRASELLVNERRKVERSLQVYYRHGKPHSELLSEQRRQDGGGALGGPLRFPSDDVAVIWVQCDQKILDERCDNRVEKMMKAGMLEELRSFHQEYNRSRENASYTQGIFQTIGFKEFHDYLTLPDDADDATRQALLSRGMEQMKVATRQYARKQLKWMRQRFLNGKRESPRVYAVDSSRYPDRWSEDVHDPAIRIVQAFVDGKTPDEEPLPFHSSTYSHEESRETFHCDVCQLQVKGKLQLEAHMKSKHHKHKVKKTFERKPLKSPGEARIKVLLDQGFKSHREQRKEALANLKALSRLPFIDLQRRIFQSSAEEVELKIEHLTAQQKLEIRAGKFDNQLMTLTFIDDEINAAS